MFKKYNLIKFITCGLMLFYTQYLSAYPSISSVNNTAVNYPLNVAKSPFFEVTCSKLIIEASDAFDSVDLLLRKEITWKLYRNDQEIASQTQRVDNEVFSSVKFEFVPNTQLSASSYKVSWERKKLGGTTKVQSRSVDINFHYSNNVCPQGNYDGANCYLMSKNDGFFYQGSIYRNLQKDDTCPANTVKHPTYGCVATRPKSGSSCPVDTEVFGNNCIVILPKDSFSGYTSYNHYLDNPQTTMGFFIEPNRVCLKGTLQFDSPTYSFDHKPVCYITTLNDDIHIITKRDGFYMSPRFDGQCPDYVNTRRELNGSIYYSRIPVSCIDPTKHPVFGTQCGSCLIQSITQGTNPLVQYEFSNYQPKLLTTPVTSCPDNHLLQTLAFGNGRSEGCKIPDISFPAYQYGKGIIPKAITLSNAKTYAALDLYSCHAGSFDGAHCYVAKIPDGTKSFEYANNLYTTPKCTVIQK